MPLDYTLISSPLDSDNECGYFWKPRPPDGYKSTGYLVTTDPKKPPLDELRCVRADLTDNCNTHRLILNIATKFQKFPFKVWTTRPCIRGMHATDASVGTFFCSSRFSTTVEDSCASCLKNSSSIRHAMPNLDQVKSLVNHYGPTIFFHPEEAYFPSSVSWFFKNGALLYESGDPVGKPIDASGSNLPCGGSNDGRYWIDLPSDQRGTRLKGGSLESSALYVHVKPALGGTFTDIAMWVFCPFNGPATLKLGIINVPLGKIGQHVCDWEHITLRISNFTGELWSVYFSQHSGGKWVDACDLEYSEGNRCIVYSSKSGHASFPHPGSYIQGSAMLGLGITNEASRSTFYVDSSVRYEIVAAEYLGEGVVHEPCWLQFMREWGPKIVYDSRVKMNKLLRYFPNVVRSGVEKFVRILPQELSGEEGPTGPKEKDSWVGDERS